MSEITWSQAPGGGPITHNISGAVIDFLPKADAPALPSVGTQTLPIDGVRWIGAPREIPQGVEPEAWPRLMRVAGDMYYIYRRYGLRGAVSVMPGDSRAVVYTDHTLIEADAEGLDNDLPELYARAALGEIDHLLTTVWGPPGTSLEDAAGGWYEMFSALVDPLKTAWAYGIMRRRAPDLYEGEIEETIALARQALDAREGEPLIVPDDPDLRKTAIGLIAAIAENPDNAARIEMLTAPAYRRAWDRYTSSLLDFVHMAPDADLYCHLADAAMAPYRVRVVRDPAGDYFTLQPRR